MDEDAGQSRSQLAAMRRVIADPPGFHLDDTVGQSLGDLTHEFGRARTTRPLRHGVGVVRAAVAALHPHSAGDGPVGLQRHDEQREHGGQGGQ